MRWLRWLRNSSCVQRESYLRIANSDRTDSYWWPAARSSYRILCPTLGVATQGFRPHDRNNALQNSVSQGLSSDCQAASLVIAQPKSAGENLCTQDSVLLTKVVSNLLLFLIHPSRQRRRARNGRGRGIWAALQVITFLRCEIELFGHYDILPTKTASAYVLFQHHTCYHSAFSDRYRSSTSAGPA
jgi:hypothetical protein